MYRLLLVVLCLWPLRVWAQVATVQTGEHQNFTRVVVTIPENADWQLGRNDRGYLLRVPGIAGYDLGRFFDLIPRERILDAGIGPTSDTLQMFVRCQCYVDAFLDRPNILVIDVRSGVAPADAAFEQRMLAEPATTAPAPDKRPALAAYSVPQNRLLPLVIPRNVISERASPAIIDSANAVVDEPSALFSATKVPVSQELAQRDEDLKALEEAITESLARGLSQGVLMPDIDGSEGQAGATFDDLPPPGVELRTGVDLVAVPPSDPVQRTQEGQTCPPETFFDVANWGNDLSFADQVGQLRSSFVGEFDRFDETSVLAKARLYVHFGFGREAIQALQMDGVLSQERQYLVGLAQIVDGDPVPPGLFANLVSCQTNVSLWALLAAKEGGLDGQVDPASVLRAFKTLPLHLQSHLGPRLSERFLAIGDEESALQALSRAVAEPKPSLEAELAAAELFHDLGEREEANATLTRLARTESRTTPEAITAFLEAAIRDDIIISTEDFALADALRFEHASTPEAEALALAQMRAYLHQRDFDPAQELIDELALSAGPSVLTELNAEFAEAVSARANDLQFLDFAFSRSPSDFSMSVSVDIADRLLDLGFPQRALAILENPEATGDEQVAQYLRAEAALMMGDAVSATRVLEGLDTPQATILSEAASLVALGEEFDRAEPSTTAGSMQSWRRGDWAALSSSSDPLLRDVSNAVLLEPSAISQETPLASGLELLEQSEQSRAIVERLLERFESPSDS